MNNPAVATFCRESLRNCLMIMGEDMFKAEVDYLLRCYGGGAVTDSGTAVREAEAVTAVARASAVAAAGGAGSDSGAVDSAATGASATVTGDKWARKPVPDDQRCHRVTPYNGGRCTFRAAEGTKFCNRHTGK